MTIDIYPYTTDYRNEVSNLISGIQRNEFDIDIKLEDQPDLQNIESFYQNGQGNFWLAFVNKELAGTVALLDIGNRQGALRKMFVKEKFRGKQYGVASLLLKTLFTWSEAKAYREIFLGTTIKFLAAHRFYEKNGFEEIEKNKLPPAFPVMKVDTKFYQYTINA